MTGRGTNRIARLARVLHGLSTLALVAVPLGVIVALAQGAVTEARLRATYAHLTLPTDITVLAWSTIFGALAISVALVVLALWHMRALFALYAAGQVLGTQAASRILKTGQAVLTLALVGLASDPITALALTWGNPDGTRSLAIMFGTNDLFFAFTGGLLTVIGWAMVEAAHVAEENAGFV